MRSRIRVESNIKTLSNVSNETSSKLLGFALFLSRAHMHVRNQLGFYRIYEPDETADGLRKKYNMVEGDVGDEKSLFSLKKCAATDADAELNPLESNIKTLQQDIPWDLFSALGFCFIHNPPHFRI